MALDFNQYLTGKETLAEAAQSVRALKRDMQALSKTIDEDSSRIKAGFEKITAAVREIQAKGGGLNLTSEADRKSLRELLLQLEEVKAAKADLKRQDQDRVAAQKLLKESTTAFTVALREQRDAFKAAYQAGDLAGMQKAGLQIRALKQDSDALARATRGVANEFTAAKGSYEEADNRLKSLRAEFRALQGGLDGTNPRAAELTKQINELDSRLKSADQAIGNGYRSIGLYAKGIIEAVEALQREKTALEQSATALRLQAGATGLSAEQQNKLQQELRATDQELDRVNGDLAKYGVRSREASESGASFGLSSDKASAGLKSYAGSLVSAYFGLSTLSQALGTAYDDFTEFEQAQSSLSAITGATGKDLEYYAEQANRIGPAVGKSGADTLKAFELIGSAQPDLLKSKEALASVTEQALLLAAASGDELPAAADALTSVMNQFQAPARDAARYVNALAAGAKEGAATIPQAAASLKYFGVNAASANVNVEQSVALIQVLAERSIKGEQAGTQLRNMFAKLASGAKDTNPEVVGLETALDNLGKKNLSTAQLTKLFGVENVNSARIIIDSREKVKSLTLALTGTQTATEQAARQLDNTATAGRRLSAMAKSAGVAFIGSFAPAIRSVFNGLTGLIGRLSGVTKSFEESLAISTRTIASNQAQAQSAQTLLDRYITLTEMGVKPNADQVKELDVITLKLRDSLGENVIAIDKETGALTLNKEAVKEAIKQKLLLANQEAGTLALQANTLKEQAAAAEKQAEGFKRDLGVRKDALAEVNLQLKEVEKLSGRKTVVFDFATPNTRNTGFTNEQRTAQSDYLKTSNQLNAKIQEAQDATSKYNDILAKLATLGFSAADVQRLFNAELKKTNEELGKGKDKAPALLDQEEVLNRNAKAQAEALKKELEGRLALQERLIEDTKRYQQEQGKLFEDHQLTAEQFAKAVAGTQTIITTAERDAAALRVGIAQQEALAKEAEAHNEYARITKSRKISQREQQDAQRAMNTELRSIAQELARDVEQIHDELQKKLLAEPIEFSIAEIDPGKFLKNQQTLDQINDAALRRMNETADREKAAYDLSVERAKEAEERKRQAREETIGLLIQAEQAYFDLQAQRNQAAISDEERSRDQQLKAAGDNEDLKIQIQEDSDARLRQLRLKQAQQEKTAGLFSIAIQTAVAVAKSFAESPATFGLPFSAIALANGAIQASLIASQPLPAYWVGRSGGKAEFAQVAERGPELIEGRSGGMRLVEKPSIVFLDQDDKVHTAQKTQVMLQAAERGEVGTPFASRSFSLATAQLSASRSDDSVGRRVSEEIAGATEASTERIVQAIKEIPRTGIIGTERGWEEVIRQGNHLTRLRNKRLNR